MLESIHVENVALIEEASVQLDRQLNILTGETGAGKSIIIGSVSMALGGKASKDIIRTGASYALAELDFEVSEEKIRRELEKLGLTVINDHVIISRRLTPGRSISRINGEMVSLPVLRQAASLLIDIHGQHDHQSLLSESAHLHILDAFAGEQLSPYLDRAEHAYREYTALQQELDNAVTDEEKRRNEISWLRFQISEIDDAALREGEEEELHRAFRKMNASREIMESVEASHAMTGYERAGAGELIGRALSQLMQVQKYDEGAGNLIGQLSDIDALLNDFNRELADYRESLVFDDESYAATERRLDLISGLEAKYGSSIEKILAHRQTCQERLEKLEGYDTWLQELHQRYAHALQELETVCGEITQIRSEYAGRLQERITDALRDLNFLDVRFEIRLKDAGRFSAAGRDEARFLISTNPGEELRPLSKVASGGELSRIMLAIKSVLADTDEIPSLIFDEIDAGISGRTAQRVSEKMAVLSRSRQVICITHLPQIASMADTHFVIEKQVEGERTITQIRCLDDEQADEEVARLLGGARITDAVRENAREMRRLAAQVKGKK